MEGDLSTKDTKERKEQNILQVLGSLVFFVDIKTKRQPFRNDYPYFQTISFAKDNANEFETNCFIR
nr:MAG TPA: hypothetical protein [Caudoviricetes sp.]